VAAVLAIVAASTKISVGGWGSFNDILMPGIALSLAPMAYIARLTRVAMLDTLGSDFVRTARAKGLSRGVVIWKHCLRNAFLPVLSYLGPAAAYTLTGSFVVEKVFTIPGLGQHFVNSVLNRDRTLILGVVMVYSVFLLVFNLVVDVAYAWLDPRIDLTAKVAA
jgi:oligopeptide transport system permease protein